MSTVRLLRRPSRVPAAPEGGVCPVAIGPVADGELLEPSMLEKAEALYRQRKLKGSSFAEGTIFQDPAWDLVLEVFIAQLKGQMVSVTGACEGAGLPTSTGLRWLRALETLRMIETSPDFSDRRRRLVMLLPETVEAMRSFLGAL